MLSPRYTTKLPGPQANVWLLPKAIPLPEAFLFSLSSVDNQDDWIISAHIVK